MNQVAHSHSWKKDVAKPGFTKYSEMSQCVPRAGPGVSDFSGRFRMAEGSSQPSLPTLHQRPPSPQVCPRKLTLADPHGVTQEKSRLAAGSSDFFNYSKQICHQIGVSCDSPRGWALAAWAGWKSPFQKKKTPRICQSGCGNTKKLLTKLMKTKWSREK